MSRDAELFTKRPFDLPQVQLNHVACRFNPLLLQGGHAYICDFT